MTLHCCPIRISTSSDLLARKGKKMAFQVSNPRSSAPMSREQWVGQPTMQFRNWWRSQRRPWCSASSATSGEQSRPMIWYTFLPRDCTRLPVCANSLAHFPISNQSQEPIFSNAGTVLCRNYDNTAALSRQTGWHLELFTASLHEPQLRWSKFCKHEGMACLHDIASKCAIAMQSLTECSVGGGWHLDLQNALRSHQGWLQCSTREDQEDALHCCGRFCASRRRLGQSWKCETFQTAAVVLSWVVDREAGSTMVASQAKCSRTEQAISGLNPPEIPDPKINSSSLLLQRVISLILWFWPVPL